MTEMGHGRLRPDTVPRAVAPGRVERALDKGLDRFGPLVLALLLGLASTLSSAVLCYGTYALFDPGLFDQPIAMTLPVAVPIVVATPSFHQHLRAHQKLREYQRWILRQNLLLEEAAREKDRIFSVIGHDLRGQLNIVSGFADLISRRSATMSTEKVVDYAEQIATAARSTSNILTDLLEWGRFKAGRIGFEPTPTDISDLADYTIHVLEPLAEAKSLRIERTGNTVTAEVDPGLFQTILRNIIGNGIKFTPREGAITVDIRAEGGKAVLTISDTGIGMDIGQLDRVRRGEISTSSPGTDGETGTGLGLVICREIIDRHNGAITVDSGPGEGTTVAITLPTAHRPVSLDPVAHAPA